MSKIATKKVQVTTSAQHRSLYTAAPWTARHQNDHSEVEAYIEATGNWTTVLEIDDSVGIDAEATTDFIVRAVNAYDVNRSLIHELASALRQCLATGGLEWKTEHSAELAVRKAEQLAR